MVMGNPMTLKKPWEPACLNCSHSFHWTERCRESFQSFLNFINIPEDWTYEHCSQDIRKIHRSRAQAIWVSGLSRFTNTGTLLTSLGRWAHRWNRESSDRVHDHLKLTDQMPTNMRRGFLRCPEHPLDSWRQNCISLYCLKSNFKNKL